MFEDSSSGLDFVADEPMNETSVSMSDQDALELEAAVSAHVFGAHSDAGLGILFGLARKGEYDPWDVDIVSLTDSYLQQLDEELDAQELGQVARMIFYAAALIHLKAQALADREAQLSAAALVISEDEFLFEDGLDPLTGLPRNRLRPGDMPLLYPDFMAEPGRGGISLAPRERPPRKRGITLVDLIVALRSYDERLAEREAELADEPLFDADIALDECVGSSHQDELDRDLVDVRHELWDRLEEGSSVCLEQLITPSRNRPATYLALLFLAQDEEILLEQEDFYGELEITRGRYFGEIRAGVDMGETADEQEEWPEDEDLEDLDEEDESTPQEVAEEEEEAVASHTEGGEECSSQN